MLTRLNQYPHAEGGTEAPLTGHGRADTLPKRAFDIVIEDFMRPRDRTCSALRAALGSGSPGDLVATNPLCPVLESEPLSASKDAWLRDDEIPDLPTPALLRSWARAQLVEARDPHTAALALEATRATPLAYEPEDMVRRAHEAGYDKAAPVRYIPVGERPYAGTFPPADIDALYGFHAQRCDTCGKGAPCYGATAHNLLNKFTWPFTGSPPARKDTPPVATYDPVTAPLLKEAIALGVFVHGDPKEARFFAHAFNAPKREVRLSEEEYARLAGDPSGATALAIAQDRTSEFMRSYEKALGEGASPATAWERASEATGTAVKPRIVVDLSGLNECTRDLHMRYASLQSILEVARPGAKVGKKDLRRGFHMLMTDPDFLPYTACMAVLEPGGPQVCLFHARGCMGGKPIPWLFSVFTGLIREVIIHELPSGMKVVLIVYLDDIVWICFGENAAADWVLVENTITKILNAVRAPANPTKCTPAPTATETALGLEILCDEGPMIRLPAVAEVKTLSLVAALRECASRGLPAPASALASLAGRLVWRAQVDPEVPAYTRALAASAYTTHPKWWQYPSRAAIALGGEAPRAVEIRSELNWLWDRASAPGARGMRLLRRGPSARLLCSSDASGTTNTVTVVTPTVAIRFVLPDCEGVAVPTMEALAMPLLFAHTGETLKDTSVIQATDCLGAAYWVANGRARRDDANDLLKLIARHNQVTGSRLCTKWLSRAFNFIPDRGCAAGWDTLTHPDTGELRDTPLPARLVEVRVPGLPHVFLEPWARRLSGEAGPFEFSKTAWECVNSRGSR